MATHVTYDEAMANLQSMFQSTDPQIIAQLLHQNRGHLERTVEQLLMMDSGAMNQAMNQSLGVPEPSTRRRSSAAEAPRVGGSNLPDDFMRPPSYFGSKSSSQIDQDAILAQMLQDELFMAEIRANPDLYFEDQQPTSQPISQPVNQPASQGYSAPSFTGTGVLSAGNQSGRGDFTGMGAGGTTSQAGGNQSFKERWNGLTAAAKKRLLTVAGRMKTNDQPSQANNRKYRLSGDLDTSLLDSDADLPVEQSTTQSPYQSNNLLGKKSNKHSSDVINERDIELVNEVEDGVYVNDGPVDDDHSAESSVNQNNNRGYVPPAAKRWGQKLQDQE